METWVWWERLPPPTREWLIDHNGEYLPADVVDEIVDATGGKPEEVFAVSEPDEPRRLADKVVDWIEAVANGESV
ncbi:hypothetical protein GCM10009776_20100 [Microbacterium deminutum]|uniref:Uncharacterized protein n=2 Tax=Microbacterium deminutum TaxID=344164 RepID=A0ABN2QTF3_9MICO